MEFLSRQMWSFRWVIFPISLHTHARELIVSSVALIVLPRYNTAQYSKYSTVQCCLRSGSQIQLSRRPRRFMTSTERNFLWWCSLTGEGSLGEWRTCSIRYCTVLYCTVLYCTALHCTALHCTALHCAGDQVRSLHCGRSQPVQPAHHGVPAAQGRVARRQLGGDRSHHQPEVAALYCTVLYCTVLHCTVLYCTVLYCTVLYCTVLYCTVLYCTALYCTALYCTVLHCTVLHCTVLYCTVLHCTVLHCTALHCTALHCTVLYCTALHCTVL